MKIFTFFNFGTIALCDIENACPYRNYILIATNSLKNKIFD